MLKSEGIKGVMRRLILVVSCLALVWVWASGQSTDAPSFEVASVKSASPAATSMSCSGGPGTTSPGIWTCSNVPLVYLIGKAYGFQPPQFSLRDSCCQARFDITAKVPTGTTKEQFQRMIQNLVACPRNSPETPETGKKKSWVDSGSGSLPSEPWRGREWLGARRSQSRRQF